LTISEGGSYLLPAPQTERAVPKAFQKKTDDKAAAVAPTPAMDSQVLADKIIKTLSDRVSTIASLRFFPPELSSVKDEASSPEAANIKAVSRLRQDLGWILTLFRRVLASIAYDLKAHNWIVGAWSRTVNRVVDTAFVEVPKGFNPSHWFLEDSPVEYEFEADKKKLSFAEAIPNYKEFSDAMGATKSAAVGKEPESDEVKNACRFALLEYLACLAMCKLANSHVDAKGNFVA
jgi:hypothetical protein